MAESDVRVAPRAPSATEVAHFQSRGWVKLPQLIPEREALELRARAEAVLQGQPATPVPPGDAGRYLPGDPRTPRDTVWWREYYDLARTDARFGAVGLDAAVTRNVRALTGSPERVRFNVDFVACKLPGDRAHGNGPTDYHQDFPSFPFDRPGNLVVWLALDTLVPEQGLMRFLEGSHRAGVLLDARDAVSDIEAARPDLVERFPLSPPLHYRPGDATVHHGLVVHGAPRNTTDRPRWSYQCAYFTDDVRYTGAPCPRFDGLGLVAGERIDHPRFPLLPAPEDGRP